jgi:hypothetical protein
MNAPELSEFLLDHSKNRDDYMAEFLHGRTKVWVPTGEGETFPKALEAVLKLSISDLPVIPGLDEAPESWRRLVALYRELSRLSASGRYFLSYRDAAKVHKGLTPQAAHAFTKVLPRLGVIEIVCKGKPGPLAREAAEFRYLLPQGECPDDDDDEIPV